MISRVQRLYCYVDESGQDPRSAIFIVVAVVSESDQHRLREQLITVESLAKTGQRKWHKSRSERRLKYLEVVLERQIAHGEVYVGRYQKPLPYFLPVLETIEHGIRHKAIRDYRATVYIDGIDKKKAAELTNAFRLRGIRLELVRSTRDESEPLIRLADMWAGCIRAAALGDADAAALVRKALRSVYLMEIQ